MYLHVISKNYICYIWCVYIYILPKHNCFRVTLDPAPLQWCQVPTPMAKYPRSRSESYRPQCCPPKDSAFQHFSNMEVWNGLRSIIFYDIYDMKKLRTGMKWFKIYDLLWFHFWDDPQIPAFSIWSLKRLPSSRTWIYTRDGVTSPMFTRPGQQKTNWNIMEHPAFSSWVNHHF